MTERDRRSISQHEHQLTIGPSNVQWNGSALVVDIDERGGPPWFGSIRGRIILTPLLLYPYELALTEDSSHIWRPFAPIARIRTELEAPGWNWEGHGYFDANFGDRALEDDFDYWTWSRYPTNAGAAVFYDAIRRDGSTLKASIQFGDNGEVAEVVPPPSVRLPRSFWALRRETRADHGHKPRQVMSMLDAPFYTRSLLRTHIFGSQTVGVHETLDLGRLRSKVIMPMLACRVPRVINWKSIRKQLP